ncbi:hypothetical protein [Streptomyces jumonjinensis]
MVTVIAVIIVVIGSRPDPATAGTCSMLLIAATEAYRCLTR